MNFEERLKAAVAASAAPVPEDFLQTTEQMIDRLPRKERIIMRNKLSYGLVLAIILCLLTLTAVAAVLLTGKELVETEVLPMALKNDQAHAPLIFTNEELAQIAALAEQNGVTLGENTRLALENGLDILEKEVVRELAYATFGTEPMFWTLEEQYWFHQAMEELGMWKNDHLLPGEGDLTEAEAVARAMEELRRRTDSGVAFLDHPDAYRLARSYQMAYSQDGQPSEKLWIIGFLDKERNFFYQVMLNQAGEYIGSRMDEQIAHNDTFTHAELQRIVALAKENGIELSENILRALEKGEGYWEGEVIMSLAKAQFGPYPGQWTLEEQYWFEETMMAIGFKEQNRCHIPGEGEMSYEEAYAKAREHIAAQGHDISILDDRSKYALWRSCYAEPDATAGVHIWWNFWFEPMDADLPEFDLNMDADGNLTAFRHQPGLSDALASGMLNCNDVQDYFTDIHGSRNKWSPEIFMEYVTMLRQTDLSNASRGIHAFAATDYCLPPEGALTTDQALAIAKDAAGIKDAISCSFTCFMVNGRICWKVTMCQDQQVTRDMVEMDAMTGEILEVYQAGSGHVAQFYVPRSVWDATPEPTPDGLG